MAAGAGKVGKSFWALDLCVSIATGGKMWEFSCEHGDALYLALEDNYPRLQDRLNKIKASNLDISRLKLVTSSFGISSGLLEQTHNHLLKYHDTKIIIADTLEKIRDTEFDDDIFSCDYKRLAREALDITALRKISNKHELTLLLVHHTRKMRNKDPLNTLSGSMGLVGAVDGVFVFQKLTRFGDDAVLTISNRDTEDFCFLLMFNRDNCKWSLMGNYEDGSAMSPTESSGKAGEKDEWLAVLVDELVQDEWCGTATELCGALKQIDPDADVIPHTISRRLISNTGLLNENGIAIELARNHSSRSIRLYRRGGNESGQDGDIDCPHKADTTA